MTIKTFVAAVWDKRSIQLPNGTVKPAAFLANWPFIQVCSSVNQWSVYTPKAKARKDRPLTADRARKLHESGTKCEWFNGHPEHNCWQSCDYGCAFLPRYHYGIAKRRGK